MFDGQAKAITQEFKLEAARLPEAGSRPAAVIARESGVPRNRLYKWQVQVRKNGAAAFPGLGRGGSNDELGRLRRELERMRYGWPILLSLLPEQGGYTWR